MKETFLKLVAHDLVNRYGVNLSKLIIVFPNNTPISTFSKLLHFESKECLIKPSYTTVTGLFKKFSGLRTLENLQLICVLYKSYCEILCLHNAKSEDKIGKMTFDEFYQWGEMLLNDFNDIDKALIDESHLFLEVSNIKGINENYLNDEQKDILKRFFLTFEQTESSNIRKKFRRIWNLINDIYIKFNEFLAKDQLAYEGVTYKKGLGILKSTPIKELETCVFIGFNSICQAEKELMHYLKDNKKALFYWDYDLDYCNSNNEAGRFIYENIKTFGNLLDKKYFDNISLHNEISIINSPTKSGSIYFAKKWLAETSLENSTTTIIPASKDIMPMMIHSLVFNPSNFVYNTKYPISITSAYTLLMRCADKLAEKNLKEEITSTNDYIQELVDKESDFFETFKEKIGNEKNNCAYKNTIRIELEKQSYIFIIDVVTHIKDLTKKEILPANVKTIKNIIKQQLNGKLISLEKATNSNKSNSQEINICELSETRMLDYDNILIIGCNEGNIPSSTHTPSIIPSQVRLAYGLPTNDNRNAIGAYNFFRLIQRARNVSLVFTSEQSGLRNKEMSRFILQIIGEDKIAYKPYNIIHPAIIHKNNCTEIQKTHEMFDKIKYLEATSLYKYIRCPLMFFYSKVAKINTPAPDINKMPANLFGTLFHEAIQLFYESKYNDKEITKDILECALNNNGEQLDPFIKEAFENNNIPNNAIIYKIVKEYLKNVLSYDKKNVPFKIEQQYIEKFLYTTIPVNFKNGNTFNVKIGGKFDRVDIMSINGRETMRVVDYKTSKWKGSLNLKDCHDLFKSQPSEKHYDYIFQTFLYCLALSENINKKSKDCSIAPAVFFITAANKPKFTPYISYNNDEVLDFSKIENEFKNCIKDLLQDIFNIDKPFTKGDDNACMYCDFKLLCNR